MSWRWELGVSARCLLLFLFLDPLKSICKILSDWALYTCLKCHLGLEIMIEFFIGVSCCQPFTTRTPRDNTA